MKRNRFTYALLVLRISMPLLMLLPGLSEAKGLEDFKIDKGAAKEAESVLSGYWNYFATYGIYGSLFAAAFFAFILRKTEWVGWAIGGWLFFALGDDVAKYIAGMGGWSI